MHMQYWAHTCTHAHTWMVMLGGVTSLAASEETSTVLATVAAAAAAVKSIWSMVGTAEPAPSPSAASIDGVVTLEMKFVTMAPVPLKRG